MNVNHEWKLVAPWYRWQRQFAAEGRKPSQTRPVFQKFEQTNFVKTFTQDPQRSLKFIDNEDTVFNTLLKDTPNLVGGPFPTPPPSRFTKLYAPRTPSGDAKAAQEATLAPTGVRKLYLPTHKRFYLVVSELHCYAPGFPTVTRDQVCQAGFVVRRRSLRIPPAQQKVARKEAEQILREINSIQADIGYWKQTTPARKLPAKRRTEAVKKAIADGSYESKLKNLELQLEAAHQKLAAWRVKHGVTSVHEGWIPGSFENIGSWQNVDETPQQITESIFPLFTLFPDPNNQKHSAKGKNIYFGVAPTSSLDTDEFGVARFDSDATYEIRCFARRHKPECPRRDQAPDCHGELWWSEPTEVYKLATPTDLIGTSNRPVTIRMPDFSELAAQAAALPVSKLAPVRVIHPQSMSFDVEDGKASGGGVGGFQICFISIPLITIVAMFLLKLFLPIVVFLFGLFFLLQLKFCIPPSLSFSAGMFAKLDALAPKLEVDASLDVDVEFDASLGLGFSAADLNTDLRTGIADENQITDPNDIDDLEVFSNAALLPVGEGINEARSLTDGENLPKPEAGLDLTGSLEFEPRVEVSVK
jgi:hypothetical protein